MKYKRFMVIGGAGFVGSHLVDRLVDEWAEKVSVVDDFSLGSMRNLNGLLDAPGVTVHALDACVKHFLETALLGVEPEVVFNLATKPLKASFEDPCGAYMTSVEIASNLAELLREKKYEVLVHFSSSEVYGSATPLHLPLQDKPAMDESHPMVPITPYAAGKASADLLLLAHRNVFGGNISIIRPFNIYGPKQNAGSYAAVIPLTIKRILDGLNPVIEWDGHQTRDFTYVDDVVDAALRFPECDSVVGKAVNVGSGEETSIIELVFKICELMGHPTSKIDFAGKRPGDVRRHLADVSLAEKLIGYKPKTVLNDGLKKTVEWYVSEAK